MLCNVMLRYVMLCQVMSCNDMSCHAMSCHAMSCHAMLRHGISCHVVPCHIISCRVVSCGELRHVIQGQAENMIPGHALHANGLQRQIGDGTLVSNQERRAAVVPRINR